LLVAIAKTDLIANFWATYWECGFPESENFFQNVPAS